MISLNWIKDYVNIDGIDPKELASKITKAGINVESLNIADTKDFGIVRMVTDDNKKAVEALNNAGFTTASTDLIGIEVPDVPGSLTDTLGMLSREGVNLEYVYSYSRKGGKALILFKTDDVKRAEKLLK